MYRIKASAILSVGLSAIAGCALESPAADLTVEAAALTASGITISTNNTIADEHCRVHTSRAAQWPAGRALLVYRGTTLRGACTVDGGGAIDADTIEMSRTMMKNRVWLSTDGMDPLNASQIVASIPGVTVRNEAPSAPAAPQITAAVTTLAGLEVDGDDTMREYTTTPTGSTGITVGYTAPHPTENPLSGGLGRSYLGWKAAQGKLDAAHDAFWTVGWRGNRGHCVDDPEVPGGVKYSHAGNLLDSCSFDEGIGSTNYVNVLAQDGSVRATTSSAACRPARSAPRSTSTCTAATPPARGIASLVARARTPRAARPRSPTPPTTTPTTMESRRRRRSSTR